MMQHFSESEVKINGAVGRSSSYEVTINGELVFSKLKQGGFPVFDEVAESIRHAMKGETYKITAVEKSSCMIL